MEEQFPLNETIPFTGYIKRVLNKLLPVILLSLVLTPAFLFVFRGNIILSVLLFLFIPIFFIARYAKFGKYYITSIKSTDEYLLIKIFEKDNEHPEIKVLKNDLDISLEPTGERGKTGNKLVLKSESVVFAEQYQVGNWNLERMRNVFKKLKEWKKEELQPHEIYFLQ